VVSPPPLLVAVADVAMFVLGLHVETQVLDWHTWPAVHFLVHVPQWLGSFVRLTHWPLQFVVPLPHTTVQLPFWQLCPDEHLTPHPPQLFGSVLVVTHWLPHLVVPPEHTRVQAPLTQL
jgi:hypothetical protein